MSFPVTSGVPPALMAQMMAPDANKPAAEPRKPAATPKRRKTDPVAET
jgi:hypothetical protein